MKRLFILVLSFFIFLLSYGQDKWDIYRCVEYALKNNISIRQTALQTHYAELTFQQSKAAQFPALNFSGSVGYRFGRSDNPTTGVVEDNNFLSTGMQLQSQVNLFNWFSQKNTIASNKLNLEADKEQVNKVQNDISLNVAVAYLQILLANEQASLARIQVGQTLSQLDNTRKRVEAGSLPELNAAQLEAQLAKDSSTLVAAETSKQQFVLQMKALLNLDAAAPFDVATPPVDRIPIEPLAELMPDKVYALAMSTLPQQKVNNLRIQAAQKAVAAAKGNMYPTFSAFGSLSTNYVNIKVPQYQPGPYTPSEAIVTVGGTDYSVYTPSFIQVGEKTVPIGRQFKNNFGQNFGIGLNIPIFNGKSARTAWERSKLNVKQLELDQEAADMQLKQDIYTAYNDAVAAMQKYQADQKAVAAAEKAYDFASKRYDVSLLSTYDLISSQNSVLQAKVQAVYSRYDYIFKMKLLEFYKGQGIKL